MTRRLVRRMAHLPRRALALSLAGVLGTGVLVAAATGFPASASPAGAPPAASLAAHRHGVKPTVVLVHGAFADAGGWSSEIRFLTRAGFPVIAPANPLRGVASDAAYLDELLDTIPGPVVLVGHSYGGAVIAAAARNAPNVKALVYVSAFIPEQKRPAAYYTSAFPGSLLSSSTLLFRPTYNPTVAEPTVNGTQQPPGAINDKDVYIQPAAFRAVFAADQSPGKAAVMAAAQRPVSLAAYTEPTEAAAALPSWDLISLDDKAIPPAAQEYMAAQAHSHVTAIHSAHDSLISHPRVVDALIVAAAAGVH